MRNILERTAAAVLFLGSCAITSHATEVSYSSVTFRSADYLSFHKKMTVSFEDALVEDRLVKVSVPLNSVEVVLEKSEQNYTTLNIYNVEKESPISLWLMAERATVVVRDKKDFALWKKFLKDLERKYELEQKERREPRRVLPPKDIQ